MSAALFRAHWRVPSEVIDRVVAERRARAMGRESLSAAAKRHGMKVGALRYWLVSAGLRQHTKPWLLDPVEVDRVVEMRRSKRGPGGTLLPVSTAKRVVVACEVCKHVFHGDPAILGRTWAILERKNGRKAYRCPEHLPQGNAKALWPSVGTDPPKRGETK